MTLTSRQTFTDQLGDEWVLTTVLAPGGVRLSITTPTGLTRELNPTSEQKTVRDSVDAEQPLPLEIA